MFDRTMPFPPTFGRLDLELELELDDDVPHHRADPAPSLHGLPQDRAARIAARRAFVEMKQLFLRASRDLDHHQGRWLSCRIRAASDPGDLLQLRGPLLDALREDEARRRAGRAELYQRLGGAFVEGSPGLRLSLEDAPVLPDAWQVWSGDVRPALRLGR